MLLAKKRGVYLHDSFDLLLEHFGFSVQFSLIPRVQLVQFWGVAFRCFWNTVITLLPSASNASNVLFFHNGFAKLISPNYLQVNFRYARFRGNFWHVEPAFGSTVCVTTARNDDPSETDSQLPVMIVIRNGLLATNMRPLARPVIIWYFSVTSKPKRKKEVDQTDLFVFARAFPF